MDDADDGRVEGSALLVGVDNHLDVPRMIGQDVGLAVDQRRAESLSTQSSWNHKLHK